MDPEPVSDIDDQLQRSLRGMYRARWWGVGVLALALAAAVAVGAFVILQQQQRLQASCQFYRLIATLPIPAAHQSREGILLVLDSRGSYRGEGCGTLPPAAPSLLHWSAYYHLKVTP